MRNPFGAALLYLSIGPLLAQSPATVPIKVRVISSLDHAPIAGASIVIEGAGANGATGRSDPSGSFAASVDAAETTMLVVTRPGFRMAEGNGLGLLLHPNSSTGQDVTIEMLPLGLISGRVVDQFGDPIRQAVVHVVERITLQGQDTYPSSKGVTTDDLGEFRIPNVEPGNHYLVIEFRSDSERGRASRFKWPVSGGVVVYPDASDFEHAQPVSVAPGQTVRTNDVRLSVVQLATVSGRVAPPPSRRAAAVSLRRMVPLPLNRFAAVQSATPNADGAFSIEGTLPGEYILTATDSQAGKTSKQSRLMVADENIGNIVLELNSGYQIRGHISVTGGVPIDFSKLTLGFGGGPVNVGSDGTFQANLLASEGHYSIQGLPDDWYVKDVVIAGRRISQRSFTLPEGASDFEITLNPRGASVQITVDGTNSPMDVAMVVLLPEGGPVPGIEDALASEADSSGHFLIRSVPPGTYRVFTLNASNWALLMRPELLLERNGKAAPLVKVAEGDHQAITVPLSNIKTE